MGMEDDSASFWVLVTVNLGAVELQVFNFCSWKADKNTCNWNRTQSAKYSDTLTSHSETYVFWLEKPQRQTFQGHPQDLAPPSPIYASLRTSHGSNIMILQTNGSPKLGNAWPILKFKRDMTQCRNPLSLIGFDALSKLRLLFGSNWCLG